MNITKLKKQEWLMLLFIIFTTSLQGQSDYFTSNYNQSNGYNIYHFQPNMDNLLADYPLESDEGSYVFFWSFGDGQYSFEEEPFHTYYASDSIEVMMIATPIYSPIPPPPAFSNAMGISGSGVNTTNPDPMLFLVRDPVPEFSSLAVINYENISSSLITDAKVRLYFNSEYFTYLSSQVFNEEIDLGIKEDNSLLPNYNTYLEFNVGDLAVNEQHTLFVDLEASLNVIGDIGDPLPELYLKAELIDERLGEIIIIQSGKMKTKGGGSWDPNSKYANTKVLFLNDIQTTPATISYKINFQNTGIAPAKNVTIEDFLPSQFDLSSFQLTDHYHPEILVSDSFTYSVDLATGLFQCTFHNINLKGLNQSGSFNPINTTGFITFDIETDAGLNVPLLNTNQVLSSGVDSCTPYDSIVNSAKIIFDLNIPIVTNSETTDLYFDKYASCFISHPSPFGPVFTVVPNPVTNGVIKIKACDVPINFPNNSISYQIFKSSGQALNCNLNPVVHNNWSSNSCIYITLSPHCLDAGLYLVKLIYFGNIYNFNVVVN